MESSILKKHNYDHIICPSCKGFTVVDSLFCIKCGYSFTGKKASSENNSGENLFHSSGIIPSIEVEKIDSTVEKLILNKKQKTIPLDNLKLNILSFLAATGNSGNQLGLKSLALINVEPREYQTESVMTILESMGGSGILADEVGLGKTIEAGIIIKEISIRYPKHKMLILVPASLIQQWKEELKDKFELDVYTNEDLDKLENENFTGIFLISLHRAKTQKIQSTFLKISWDLLVVDEAHALKNHLTQAHKFVYNLRRKYTVLLTATPIQNDIRELYNLINVVKPGFFKSIRLFRKKYMVDRFTPKNTQELRSLCSRVMVRHRRTDTLIKLPPREVEIIFIEPTFLEKEFYKLTMELTHKAMLSSAIDTGDHIMLVLTILLKESTSSPQALLKTLQAAILPKTIREKEAETLRKLIDLGKQLKVTSKMKGLIEKIESDPDPVIVYTEYIYTQNVLYDLLSQRGHNVHRYAGNMRIKDKEISLSKFRKEGGILLSTEVGGQGLNLQHCHRLINFDLPWNPMKLEQRIGRVHRFGQQEKVIITTIAGKGTYEEYLVNVLLSKIKLFEMVIGEIDSIISYLKDPLPIEKRIGKIIIESPDSSVLAKKLEKLAQEIVEAKNQFSQDLERSSEILDLPASTNPIQ